MTAALMVQVGSTITNGECAVRLTRRLELEGPCWLGLYISMGSGEFTGMIAALADQELGKWHHVPFEWAMIPGYPMKERYVWSDDYRRLVRETRVVWSGQ